MYAPFVLQIQNLSVILNASFHALFINTNIQNVIVPYDQLTFKVPQSHDSSVLTEPYQREKEVI